MTQDPTPRRYVLVETSDGRFVLKSPLMALIDASVKIVSDPMDYERAKEVAVKMAKERHGLERRRR